MRLEMSTRLLSNEQNKPTFPIDKYVPACITSYQIADLPAGKFATNNEPVPSVRFLFSNAEGIRKWTRWVRISYNDKAALTKLFCGFPNVASVMSSDDTEGKLWNTPMLIFCEQSDGKYINIARVKPDDNPDAQSMKDIFYSADFVPYKYVKAFGHLVPLRLAVLKLKEGVKELSPDDMVDPPADQQ